MKEYYLRRPEELALKAIERNPKALHSLLLEGPPGTGKTFFAQCLAKHQDAKFIFRQCDHWMGDEDLFIGVHVGRVAAGVDSPEDAYEYGILAKAAMASKDSKVVICLDELDKAPQRVDVLLFEFLQSGRVTLPDGQQIAGRLENMIIILTSNGVRPLSEALLRRCRRIKMGFLPSNVEADIVRKQTGAVMGAIRVAINMANLIRTKGETAPSLPELISLIDSLHDCESAADVCLQVEAWLIKSDEDWWALRNEMGSNPESILWGEWVR